MSWISNTLKDYLANTLELSAEEINRCFSASRNPKEGNYTLAGFPLAKKMGITPVQVSEKWSQILSEQKQRPTLITSFKASGPYLNFILDGPSIAEGLLKEIFNKGDHWGHSKNHQGERVCLDFSSPNIAKPFAIHHIRSTLIGASLARLLETQGFNVEKINHLGDWGTQFGYVIEAYKKYQDGQDLGDNPLKTLVGLYQKINNEAAETGNNIIHDKARHWFKKLEEGDEEAKRLWKWFRDVSIQELEKIYNRMGIHFDVYRGEAHYEDQLEATVERVNNKGLLEESEGAMVVNLGKKMPPILLKKSDGATLYATRDLAALLDRWERGNYTYNIYVVAIQQNLHFKQLFSLVDKMKHPSSGKNIHVGFGMLRMPDGTTGTTRKNNLIYLDEVLDTAHKKAREKIDDSKIDDSIDKKLASEQVGLGAVYFNDLKSKRIKDITFQWDDVLNFEGRTGAYLQFGQARMGSILSKGRYSIDTPYNPQLLNHSREKDLLIMMDKYEDVLSEAAEEFEPNTVINYLFDLVQLYSSLTQDKVEGVKILVDDENLRNARLALVAACQKTLISGLNITCIPCPERM